MANKDISKFLVHLTKGNVAEKNLISILKDKVIKAKNIHCLFSPKIKSSKTFSKILKNKFKTVCFTETPLDQINRLTGYIPRRNIKLKPYGLVFSRDFLLSEGANPAIYLNYDSTYLSEFLLKQFDDYFESINKYTELKKQEKEFYDDIIQYYSLINKFSKGHDFSWEREWRHQGDLKFMWKNVVAIIAENPKEFLEKCNSQLNSKKMDYIKRTPIISPYWNYEEIIEELSDTIWGMLPNED